MKGDGKGRRYDDDMRRPGNRLATDAKSRLQQWMQVHQGWAAIWLEGIDPPRRVASSPSVTLLMVTNASSKTGGGEEFGFICAESRIAAKKKEREKECARECVAALDQLPLDDLRSWFQLPERSNTKHDVDPKDLEQLTTLVSKRCPRVTVELPEPTSFVLVAAMPWGPERSHVSDPELAVLERFDTGFAELFKEAKRVSGLVRKQWFLAVVRAREVNEDGRSLTLGIGLATDKNFAKARAVHSAAIRAQIITESMFTRARPAEPAGAEAAPATAKLPALEEKAAPPSDANPSAGATAPATSTDAASTAAAPGAAS